MSDIREALARVVLVNAMCPGQEYIARRVADAILAEFLVVPRSELTTEYGIVNRAGSAVEANALRAEVARYRAVHVWKFPPEAASYRQLWVGPWSPIPLPEGDS